MNPNRTPATRRQANSTQATRREKGFALITALGVMVILMGIIGIMVVSSVGDLQQSRSSIQLSQARAVAEAGIAVGHDALQGTGVSNLQSIMNAYSTTFANNGGNPTTTWVVPSSAWAAVASNFTTAMNNNASATAITSSALAGVGSTSINYQLSNFRGRLLAATQSGSTQSYVMDYMITTTGTANNGKRSVIEQGSFSIQMGQASLNRYLFLVNNAGGQSGFFDSTSTFNGPVHANSNWGFTGNPQFLGQVTASDSSIWYWCGNTRVQRSATSNPPCSVPNFAQGFQFNQPVVNLPTTALGQARAALGLNPTTDANNDGIPDAPTALETCQRLRLSATCSPILTPSTGVYLPNNGSSITGGIYIQGNADSMRLDKPAAGQQRYTVVQGSTTTVILINHTTNTTTITKTPGGTTSYSGTPNGQAPVGTGGANGQIFVNGTVTALTGPARTGSVPANGPQNPVPTTIPPALAKETQLNITATGQVGITGDLTYECDPTQLSVPAYISANPNCNMNGQPLKTVLGVMSTGSDVQIKTTAPSDIYLWGSFYTAQTGQGLSVQNYNNRTPRDSGTMHLFGGLIQDTDQIRANVVSATSVQGYRESYNYDARFANGAVTPPNFPTTRTFVPTISAPVPLTFTEK